MERRDYAGYDPYDALNSPLLRLLTRRSKWCRIACTQALKRCPVNLRPLLAVRKGHNPKAIGLFLWGYAKLNRLAPQPEYQDRIGYLLDLLGELRCPGYSGNCWGYNFDWQSRTFLRPRGTPTIVNTAFIGHALLDCYALTGNDRALDLAIPITDFILGDLNRTALGDTFCFSYTPVDTGVVHNANMLGASILVRLNRYCNSPALMDAALASLAYSMQHQREDGSWYYADTPVQKWVDSFHTGFDLQALRYVLDEGCAQEYETSYHRGVEYYSKHFFLPDGTPKYFHNKTYPIDIHAPAQAIAFFAAMGDEYRDLTDRVLTWMLRHFYRGKGRFGFQKRRFYTNSICYMRWAQAWAFHALTEYAFRTCEDSDDSNNDQCHLGRDSRRARQSAGFV